jgi:hypothetical protein
MPGTTRHRMESGGSVELVTSAQLLEDAFTRVRQLVTRVVDELEIDDLTYRADPRANTIAWLVWHLTRIQDDHVAAAAGIEQEWTAHSWRDRFDLPFAAVATGYGHDSPDVAAVRIGADLLVSYHDAVCEQTLAFVRQLSDADLDRIVDRSWDPPVTLGVRLVSVISDDLQHAGQAAFIRGMLERA